MTEPQRRRKDLGCSLILFTPIFVLGAVLLASTSNDSKTTADVVWSYILVVVAALSCATGCVLWARHR